MWYFCIDWFLDIRISTCITNLKTFIAISCGFISDSQINLDESTHSGELSLHSHVYSLLDSAYHSGGSVTRVEPDSRDIEFNVLVTNITEIIHRDLSYYHLESMKHALAHATIHPMSPKPLFSDAELACIKLAKDVFELTEMCRRHWSWNSYSPLKLIVKKSGSKEAKAELKRFERTVNARKTLKEFASIWLHDGKSCPEGIERMMVIVDEDFYDDITIDQLEEVEKFICNITCIPVKEIQVL